MSTVPCRGAFEGGSVGGSAQVESRGGGIGVHPWPVAGPAVLRGPRRPITAKEEQ
jgi:hypothetical protein